MRAGIRLSLLVALLAAVAPQRAEGQVASSHVEFVIAPAGTPPGQLRNWSPAPGSEVTGTWQIRVKASSSGALESLRLRLEAEEPGLPVPKSPVVSKTYPDPVLEPTEADEVSYTWDSRVLSAKNGRYRWVAQATSYLDDEGAQAVLGGLDVNNVPLPPSEVAVRLDGEQPVVTWKANPESDILEYRVWRAPDQTTLFDVVGGAKSTEFRDSSAPPGPHIYRVNAVRRSPVSERGLPSDLSDVAGPVTVPGVPPPAPAPPPVVAAPPRQASPPPAQSFGRFNKTLPYRSVPAPTRPPEPVQAPARVASRSTSAPIPRVDARDRVRYIAVGLLLLSAALLSWRGRQALLGRARAPSPTGAGSGGGHSRGRPTPQPSNPGTRRHGWS